MRLLRLGIRWGRRVGPGRLGVPRLCGGRGKRYGLLGWLKKARDRNGSGRRLGRRPGESLEHECDLFGGQGAEIRGEV